MRGSMTSDKTQPDKTQLDEEDFPLSTRGNALLNKAGELLATAQTPGVAEDIAWRLNEDALRRQEGKWSA
jgi:hypothetical protein